MLLMGDEVRRTQLGNNNAYCQDNELSWFDWSSVERNQELLRFVKKLIHFIQGLAMFRCEEFLAVTHSSPEPHLVWHGQHLGEPDWSREARYLAFSLRHPAKEEYLHILLNAYWEPLNFELPPLEPGKHWHRIIDTALPAPDDFSDLETAVKIDKDSYLVTARSSVVLMEKAD
jgi:glycogen operon protein